MLGRTDSRRRMLVVLAVFAIIAASLLSRLAWWQVVQRDQLAAAARAQISIHYEQPSRRGTIYDRSGTVVLATSVDRYRLAATPADLTPQRRATVAQALVDLLGLTGEDAATLTGRMTADRAYVILTRDLDEPTAARIRAGVASGQLPGIALEPEPFRVYPLPGGAPGTTPAAKLPGFANREGGRREGPWHIRRSGRELRLRARIGIQGVHRARRLRERRGHAEQPHQGHRIAPAGRRPDHDLRLRQASHGLAALRGRHRLLAQRWRSPRRDASCRLDPECRGD